MIRAHVEYGCRVQIQRRRRLQLEARELQDIQLRGFGVATRGGQQIERGLTQIAADTHSDPRTFGHAAQERCDGALAVRAGDPGHGRIDDARKHLDVADDLQAASTGLNEEGLAEGYSGGCDDADGIVEQASVQPSEADLDFRKRLLQPLELRRLRPGIRDRDPPAERMQVPRARQPRSAQADDHRGGGFT